MIGKMRVNERSQMTGKMKGKLSGNLDGKTLYNQVK